MTDPARAVGAPRMVEVFLVAGEESGDRLGTALMRALQAAHRRPGPLRRRRRPRDGVRRARQPVSDRGAFDHRVQRDPATPSGDPAPHPRDRRSRRRNAIRMCWSSSTVPEFTHRVAKRVRAAAPAIPIVDYVSPSVWAWRPGRARKMRAYVDHVLGLLAVRAGRSPAARRSAVQLCRASVDRGGQRTASERRRRRAGGSPRRRCCWSCRGAGAAKSSA